jgi:hypothetical protein
MTRKPQRIRENADTQYICLKGPIRWEEIRWSLDLPEVTMVDQGFSLDLPELRMVTQTISWDFPETRCKERCDGPGIPVLVCSGFDCKVETRPSCYPSCEVTTVRQEASFDVRQVTMVRKDFVIGVPEIRMVRKDMFFHSISFYPEELCAGGDLCAETCKPYYEDASARTQELFASAKQQSDQVYQ